MNKKSKTHRHARSGGSQALRKCRLWNDQEDYEEGELLYKGLSKKFKQENY